jgi:hypothetical protein
MAKQPQTLEMRVSLAGVVTRDVPRGTDTRL